MRQVVGNSELHVLGGRFGQSPAPEHLLIGAQRTHRHRVEHVEVAGLEVGVRGVEAAVEDEAQATVLRLVRTLVIRVAHHVELDVVQPGVRAFQHVWAVPDGMLAELGCALGEEHIGQWLERREPEPQLEVDVGAGEAHREGVVVHHLQARHLGQRGTLGSDGVVSLDRREEALLQLPIDRGRTEIPCADVVFGPHRGAVGEGPVPQEVHRVVLVVSGVHGLRIRQHRHAVGGVAIEPREQRIDDATAHVLIGIGRHQTVLWFTAVDGDDRVRAGAIVAAGAFQAARRRGQHRARHRRTQ
ncbi:hypothetical protein MAUB1S_01483 [Mycolicibacterium aubagnense]